MRPWYFLKYIKESKQTEIHYFVPRLNVFHDALAKESISSSRGGGDSSSQADIKLSVILTLNYGNSGGVQENDAPKLTRISYSRLLMEKGAAAI